MRCGVGDYTLRLAKALAATDGTEVGVLTSCAADAAEGGRSVSVFPIMRNWRLNEARTVLRLLRTWKPDIVHVQYPTQGYNSTILPTLVPLLAFLAGKKVVRTWHEIYTIRGLGQFMFQALPPGPSITVRPAFYQSLPRLLRFLIRGRPSVVIASASSVARCALSPDERRALRMSYLKDKSRLIVFFGFLYRFKGVEKLFDIADPTTDQIVIAGEAGVDPDYYQELQARVSEAPWKGQVEFTGFLPDEESGGLLAIADAVVLPFRQGGGVWNSSIHAATVQGTPVVTTSREKNGLDAERQVYFARPDDVAEMRSALGQLAGKRREDVIDRDDWAEIADRHVTIYDRLLTRSGTTGAVPQ